MSLFYAFCGCNVLGVLSMTASTEMTVHKDHIDVMARNVMSRSVRNEMNRRVRNRQSVFHHDLYSLHCLVVSAVSSVYGVWPCTVVDGLSTTALMRMNADKYRIDGSTERALNVMAPRHRYRHRPGTVRCTFGGEKNEISA